MFRTRRRWIVVALLGVAVTGAVLWSTGLGRSAAGSGPLAVTPPQIDIQTDEAVSRQVELTLSNPGPGRLVIKEVRTTCACTMATPLDVYELDPGEQTVLRVRVQPPSYGTQETSITVVTDAATPEIRIPVTLRGAKLYPPYLRAAPQEIRHSTATPSEVRIPFQLGCVEQAVDPPWLTGFATESSWIDVSDPQITETRTLDETSVWREYEVTLSVANVPAGATLLTDVLRPETRSKPTRPLRQIPVSILIEQLLRAAPSTVLVSRQDLADGPFRRRVAIISATDDEWTVTAIQPSVPWVTANVVSDQGDARLVEISVSPPADGDGASQASVRIETTHPRSAATEIAVVVH